MNLSPSNTRLQNEAHAMHEAGYFIDALAKFIGKVGSDDPHLCDEALDGYVVGGLLAGLRIVGADLMGRSEELQKTLEKGATE